MALGMARKLRDIGLLGLNERNADFIMRLNPRRYYPRVDDKALTKRLAIEAGMAVPELYGLIEHQGEVRDFPRIVQDRESFVIKPAQGSGGDGIVVVTSRSKRKRDSFRLASGVLVVEEEIEHHLSNIISGQFSLSGGRDTALIEYCVQFDPVFSEVSFQGVPDVRVIVYRGYPAMAMVRLPTRASDGKANLHQGAVGAGVDLSTGTTLAASSGYTRVTEHPDTLAPIAGHRVPHWDRILEIAATGYEVSGLGYLGVDLVIDRDLGPLMLEMNARPGLNIQIANGAGLRPRFEMIERVRETLDAPQTPARRAEVSIELMRPFSAG